MHYAHQYRMETGTQGTAPEPTDIDEVVGFANQLDVWQ